MSIIPNNKTFLCQIHEDLKNDPLAIGIQGQLKSHRQVQDSSNDHAKFEFQDGLLYYDGSFYVIDGLAQFQIVLTRHNTLATSHFGFNKTMEFMFRDY